MELSFQKIGVALLVLDHFLEQRTRAFVVCLPANSYRFVVLHDCMKLVGEVDFELRLNTLAQVRGQRDVDGRSAIEKNNPFNESFGVLHLLEGTGLGEAAKRSEEHTSELQS